MADEWVDAPADDWQDVAPTAPPLAQLQPGWLSDPVGKIVQLSRDLSMGGDEAAANAASSMAAAIPAGAAGLGHAIAQGNPLGLPPEVMDRYNADHPQSAADVVGDVQDKLTYHPETESGQRASEALNDVLGIPAQAGGYLGRKTLDVTGSPAAAAAVDTAVQFLGPTLLGARAKGVHGEVAEAPRASVAPDVPEVAPEPETGNPVTDRLNAKLQDHAAAVQEYADLPDSKNGTVINTDIARELSDDYRADRTLSADVHEPASAFTKRLYTDKLAEQTPEGKEPTVLFTAGGTGAGKSSGMRAADIGNPEIVYDTNMNKLSSAKDKIDQALDAGRDVHIVYTYRDPVEAFRNGALPRAARMEGEMGSGRTVPLDEHVKTHVGASEVIRHVAEQYKDDPRVSITAIDNSRGAGNARLTNLEDLPKVEENGLRDKLEQQLGEAHANGEISDTIRAGFEGRKPEVAETVRDDPEQGNARQAPIEQTADSGRPTEPPAKPLGLPGELDTTLDPQTHAYARALLEDPSTSPDTRAWLEQNAHDPEQVRTALEHAAAKHAELEPDVYPTENVPQNRGSDVAGEKSQPASPYEIPQARPRESEPAAREASTSGVAETQRPAGAAEPLREVSARNAAIDAQREAMGLEPLPLAERKSFEASAQQARDMLAKDPNSAQRIVADHTATGRALNDAEQLVLAEHSAKLGREHEAATAEINRAREAGDHPAGAIAALRREAIENEARGVHKALNEGGGTANARGLAIRNAILKDDYSVGRNMARAEAHYSGLNDRLRSQARELTEHIKKSQDELERVQAQVEKERAAKPAERPAREAKRPQSADEREQARIEKKIAQLKSDIERRLKACPL